jgi:hypothetical protein
MRVLAYGPFDIRDEHSYSLNLARVNLNDANAGSNKLLAHRFSERADGCLSSAVDATTGVRLSASNAANVDNITATTFRALLEDWENCLGHVNKTVNVCVEHDVHIFRRDVTSMGNTLDETTIGSLLVPGDLFVWC